MTVESRGKRYSLFLPGDSDVNIGDIIAIRADIVPLRDNAHPQRLEIASLRPVRPVERVHKGFMGWKLAMDARRSFISFVQQNSRSSVIGVLNALTFNVTGDLGDEIVQDLRRTGTFHIISASGLHVSIISAALACALLLVPIPRWAQLTILTALLLFYAAAAGFHPPMIRAVAMVLVASFAYAFAREPDALSALALSGVGTLLWEPEAVGSLGFQLSYIAVGFLILFGSEFMSKEGLGKRITGRALSLARASIIATIAISPLLAYSFGEVPLLSVVTNLLVVPVLFVIVVGSLLAWVFSGFLPVAEVILKSAVEPLAGWILGVVETAGSWQWGVLKFPTFSPLWLILFYVCLALWYAPKRKLPEQLALW